MSGIHLTPDTSEPDILSAKRRSRRMIFVGVAMAVVFLIVTGTILSRFLEPTERLLQKGMVAFARGDYQAAKQHGERVLSRDANSSRALILMSQVSSRSNQFEEALRYCDRVPDDGSLNAIYARCFAGDILLLKMFKLSEAEKQYRRALKQDENNVLANERMAFLLGVGARQWETIPYRLTLIRLDQFMVQQVYLLCEGRLTIENPDDIPKYRQAAPADPVPKMAQARVDIQLHEKTAEPLKLLLDIVQLHPKLIEAQVLLGRLLFEHGSDEEFLEWHDGLPRSADENPQIWGLRGSRAARNHENETAIRCFWEAVQRDPNDAQTNYQLGQLLNSTKRMEDAAPFLRRARQIENYLNVVKVAKAGNDLAKVRKATELAEGLGLLFEAYAWADLTTDPGPQPAWAKRTVDRLKSQLVHLPLTRAIPDANPALKIDLSQYPLPNWSPTQSRQVPESVATVSQTTTKFEDLAASAGIDFTYFNGGQPLTMGIVNMYETLGGGAAVLDYDVDGWPDIYLTQGCSWPPDENQQKDIDRLYRNLGNGRFEDVTIEAGLVENRFSQGATVGDYNNDGFPDLYVANIGGNRLYRNNGDGTFTDATATTGTDSWRWSSSCVMADLNGDTLPDIFVANFLSGNDVFTRVCENPAGKPATCLPQHFAASRNQLYLNLGDGRFEEVAASTGIEVPEPGKSLGIVAADFDGSGKLSLFIANDVGPNFFFVNQTSAESHQPRFVEQSLLLGLSLNRLGQSEACMGVASGDVNQDGRIDLFATNFQKESNTLYVQNDDGLFADVTDDADLARPSLPTLGFGTQFLDGELDGDLDLIVTNGHVNDSRGSGEPYQMSPQYFQNMGIGRFVDVSTAGLGEFFDGEYLGRGLARLDWNRDGKEDVVISHLDAPVALLTNTTEKVGNYLAVELRGVRSARDAIGSTVTLKSGDRTLVRQLTAGDGFLASNERKLIFGLGEMNRIDAIEIRWPSGIRQTFTNLPINSQLLFIEDNPSYIVRRKAPVSLSMPASKTNSQADIRSEFLRQYANPITQVSSTSTRSVGDFQDESCIPLIVILPNYQVSYISELGMQRRLII